MDLDLQSPVVLWTAVVSMLVASWLGAGWLLRGIERGFDRKRVDSSANAIRAKVTRPFLWDEAEGSHGGHVSMGLEIWKARCSEELAPQLQVGDRVWVRRSESGRLQVEGPATRGTR